MSVLSKIARKLLHPDLQIQVEAGYLSEDLKLTDAGKLALLQTYYFNGGDKLITEMAKEKIAEKKAEEEKSKK